MGSRGLAVVEPDAAVWNTFVTGHPQGHLLQSSGWAELKQRTSWEARHILVVGPHGPQAGAQLLIRRSLGLSGAYVSRGPLFATDMAANGVLLAALERVARGARAVFLRLEPNVLEDSREADGINRFLVHHAFRLAPPVMPRSTIHLDLQPAPTQIFAQFSKGHRATIRRASREGIVVRQADQVGDLDAFYAIMQQTSARASFRIHSRAYYHAAWKHVTGPARTQLFLAERAGRPLAAALIFACAGTAQYLFGGSTAEGLGDGANHAIQWQAIQWARAQGCHMYDLWFVPDQFGQLLRTNDPSERRQLEETAKRNPLYGVFRFKKGFGGCVVRYLPAYDQVYLAPLYALWVLRHASFRLADSQITTH